MEDASATMKIGSPDVGAPDFHILSFPASGLSALPPCFAGVFRVKLVGVPALMGRLTALGSDFTLLLRIHTGEAALVATLIVFCHISYCE